MQARSKKVDGTRRVVLLTLTLLFSSTTGEAIYSAYADQPNEDEPIAKVIEKAEQLRRRGESREAYRVLYSVRISQTGRMGAALVNLLGSVLQDLGRLDEAEQHYRRALRMLEKEFGRDDQDLVSPLNDLGGLMMARGRLSEAAQVLERSLELRQRHYPETDPVVLRGLENLAAVRLAQKQYVEAGRLFEHARQGWENRNPGALEAAIALNGLGVLAQRKGQRVQAVTLFRSAISRWRPEDEPLLLAQIMGNLAAVLAPDEAVVQYSRAVTLVEKHGGAEHPILAPLLDGQARCLRALHRKREASELALRARRVRKANPTGFTVDTRAMSALDRLGKGDFSEIAAFMRQCGEAVVESLGITPPLRALDLGCGDGTTAVPLARLGAEVVGIDIARNLVDAGNRRAAEVGLSWLKFQEGDASNLEGVADHSLDLTLSVFGAMFALKPFDVAKQMVRVTRPGGRIVMGNWIPNDPTFVSQVLKISSVFVPPPPEGFVSPMTWGVETHIAERFTQAGVPKDKISMVKDT